MRQGNGERSCGPHMVRITLVSNGEDDSAPLIGPAAGEATGRPQPTSWHISVRGLDHPGKGTNLSRRAEVRPLHVALIAPFVDTCNAEGGLRLPPASSVQSVLVDGVEVDTTLPASSFSRSVHGPIRVELVYPPAAFEAAHTTETQLKSCGVGRAALPPIRPVSREQQHPLDESPSYAAGLLCVHNCDIEVFMGVDVHAGVCTCAHSDHRLVNRRCTLGH